MRILQPQVYVAVEYVAVQALEVVVDRLERLNEDVELLRLYLVYHPDDGALLAVERLHFAPC